VLKHACNVLVETQQSLLVFNKNLVESTMYQQSVQKNAAMLQQSSSLSLQTSANDTS